MIPEKLVEEIAKKIFALHAWPRGETDWDRAVKQAEQLIARILKAVVDGELDKALGVAGQFDFSVDDWGRFENWVAQALHDDASIFIALSPFPSLGIPVGRDPLGTGTGKGEEPSFIAEIH